MRFNSKVALLIIFIIYIFILFNQSRWKKETGVIESDAIGYYGYLTSLFIYHDVTLEFIEKYEGPHNFIYWFDKTPDNKNIIKYSCGLSYLYSPFFFLGHLTSKITGYEADGYTTPYKFFLQIGGVIFALIGLFFIRKVLLFWYSDKIAIFTLLTIGLFTNLLYYATIENTMPHVYNFALISIFLYYTIIWYEKKKIIDIVKLGFIFGLISLIRPTNGLIIIIFLLYKISSLKELKERFILFMGQFHALLIFTAIVFIIWTPQFLYWHEITGHYIYYSYGVSDETFNFVHSHFLNGLFSYRNGWLPYTPIMVFAILGLFLKSFAKTGFQVSTVVFLIFFIYITYSWWCWWYGGSFGSRPMIDMYTLLSIPLAGTIQKLVTFNKKHIQLSIISIMLIFALKGGYANFQYKYGTINYHAMTKEAYWKGFFKLKPYNGYWELLCAPDYELAKKHIYKCNPAD